jgi:hypothetical protein
LTIGKTNVSIGNAGMLPRATASIIDNNIINLSQTRTDGTINSLDNAKNNSLNYGVNLDWTVLTALKCCTRAAKRVTKGEAQLKLTIITRM